MFQESAQLPYKDCARARDSITIRRMAKTKITLPEISIINRAIEQALAEDLGPKRKDLTTELTISPKDRATAVIVSREPGIMAGGPIAARVFQSIDRRVRVRCLFQEGQAFGSKKQLLHIEGPTRAILSGERTALNFLQHLCAVATQTGKVVAAIRPSRVAVLATRKTIPGLRVLQKYAVQLGGGESHRQGLFDEVLIKENHIDRLAQIPSALYQNVRGHARSYVIRIEARNPKEARTWIVAGATQLLLDNWNPKLLKKEIPKLRLLAKQLGQTLELEASGGIHLQNAKNYARSGVDRISLGSLTHTVQALDLGLDFLSP